MSDYPKRSPEEVAGEVSRTTLDAFHHDDLARRPNRFSEAEKNAFHEKAMRLQNDAVSKSTPEVVDELHRPANWLHLEHAVEGMIHRVLKDDHVPRPLVFLMRMIRHAESLDDFYRDVDEMPDAEVTTEVKQGLRSKEVETELRRYYDGRKDRTHSAYRPQ